MRNENRFLSPELRTGFSIDIYTVVRPNSLSSSYDLESE